MAETESTSSGASIDEDALERYLETHLGAVESFDVTPQEDGSGSSNETFFVRWGGEELVLRAAPENERVPYLLHDVVAEYEVLSALAGTDVPAPAPVAACEDPSVLGTPFYLMERAVGDALNDEEPERFAAPDQRRRVGEAMVDALASLHALDADSFDVREVPEGTVEEAVEAHTENLEDALETTGRELPRAREVGDWLRENVPEPPERTLVHGDYKVDNIMFAPAGRDAGDAREQGTPPQVTAILDWEMAGVGNPRADLGWFLALWSEPDDPDVVTPEFEERYGDHPFYEAVAEDDALTARPGYPSRAELVDRYEERTGIDYRDDRFYRALGVYKLVAICERFHEVYLTNPDDSKATYPIMELLVPLLAERAALIVEGDLPL